MSILFRDHRAIVVSKDQSSMVRPIGWIAWAFMNESSLEPFKVIVAAGFKFTKLPNAVDIQLVVRIRCARVLLTRQVRITPNVAGHVRSRSTSTQQSDSTVGETGSVSPVGRAESFACSLVAFAVFRIRSHMATKSPLLKWSSRSNSTRVLLVGQRTRRPRQTMAKGRRSSRAASQSLSCRPK